MRTKTLITTLLSTAFLFAACDSEESFEPDADPQDYVLASLDEELPRPDRVVALPDVLEEQTCQTFYFRTSQNDSKKSNCMVGGNEPDLYLWDDLLQDEFAAQSSASCAGFGARDGNGNLPGLGDFGPEAPAEPGIGGKAANPADPVQAPTAPACETLCASQGKLWNSNSSNFGTCAFNRVVSLSAPTHQLVGSACPAADTQRWKMGGSVQFDCGCACE